MTSPWIYGTTTHMTTATTSRHSLQLITTHGISAFLTAGMTLSLALTVPVQAQATKPPAAYGKEKGPAAALTHPNNPEIWNAERMMEDAVLQISRRYNLNS